jgi:hypothetical protein
MSTADSQVLACTAAITDDIKPEWSQDHGKTKTVTMVIAAFATAISLVGQQFPGFGDSVFALVVFAVYGLGGIFVPLILIRMAGYEPDSKHTTSMMIAALLGVLVWTVLGFGEYVFPSVPGMGAAFAVHFLYCWKRDQSNSYPFGRITIPTNQIFAVGASLALIFVVVGLETSYQQLAPDNDSSSTPDPDSMWNLTVEGEWIEIDETILISDGATETFYFDVPSDVISFFFMIVYEETNEVGVSTVCDDIETNHDISELSPEFNNGAGISDLSGKFCGMNFLGEFSTVPNFAENDTYENHTKHIERLQVEKQDSSLAINVKIDVDRGTPLNGDSGEEVSINYMYYRYISHTLTQIE